MEENMGTKVFQEEFNFLKEELKKIDKQIKAITYGGTKDSVEADIKLWELRGMIIKEILRY
ncbi:unnamed protein product [marine sediment metagenome]|uniref:Uncharacterized protein n=1 Tax=marine sediment metagenome TaxID=412755 RepID=X1MT96_9ZZZZ